MMALSTMFNVCLFQIFDEVVHVVFLRVLLLTPQLRQVLQHRLDAATP